MTHLDYTGVRCDKPCCGGQSQAHRRDNSARPHPSFGLGVGCVGGSEGNGSENKPARAGASNNLGVGTIFLFSIHGSPLIANLSTHTLRCLGVRMSSSAPASPRQSEEKGIEGKRTMSGMPGSQNQQLEVKHQSSEGTWQSRVV